MFILSNYSFYKNTGVKQVGSYFVQFDKPSLQTGSEGYIETNDYIVFSDANISFSSSIGNKVNLQIIEENISKLKNGYVLFLDKKSDVLTLYTDIFGFYHLFYLKTDNYICISSDFNELLKYSAKQVDEFALLDILLFNYTLFERTLVKDIKRLKGGAKLTLHKNELNIIVPNNFADNFTKNKSTHKIDRTIFSENLKSALFEELNPENKNVLSITGGFDSRALLAVCKNLNLNISTFTFGQEGNIEQEIAKSFISEFSEKHTFYCLDDNYVKGLSELLDEFFKKNLDNPVILDLPQYELIAQQLDSGNLIVGFLGGELMSGQTVGSQVTFTQSAASLLLSKNLQEAELNLKAVLDEIPFLDKQKVSAILNEYLQSLTGYFYKSDKLNILKFIINESYSKFFGAVNKVFKNRCNLIVPFMDPVFITYVLNSNISFLEKTPFVKNPFANITSKIFYANCIKQLYQPLAKTRVDRLYTIDDLCKKRKIPRAAMGYIQSHLFKKNKKVYPRPHHYDLWYTNFVIDQLNSKHYVKNCVVINSTYSISIKEYSVLMSPSKKRLNQAAAINRALAIINKGTNA